MKRKRWFIASLTVVVLVLGIGGGTILAQESTSSDGTGRQSIFSRVASILGIEEQQVEDAFQQAAQEIQDEWVQQKLAMLVERGVLTQEQADEYKAWLDAQPEGLSPRFGLQGRHGYRTFRGGRGRHGGGFYFHRDRTTDSDGSTEASSTADAV